MAIRLLQYLATAVRNEECQNAFFITLMSAINIPVSIPCE